MKQSLLVLVPSPGMGHLLSAVEFAKLLLNHDHRLSIAVILIKSPSESKTQAYVNTLASNPNFPNSLQFIHLPDPDPESQSPAPYMHNLVQNSIPLIKQSVYKLVQDSDSRLAGFIVDMFCTAIIDVANEFEVPSMVFYTSGAAFLGFMLHFHALRDRFGLDTTASGFKDSGSELPIPSFVNPVPAYAFPTVVLEKQWEEFVSTYVEGLRKATGIIVNTFEELESHAVHSFSESGTTVYPVGPILNLNGDNNDGKHVQRKSEIMEWLDDQPCESVIFLCFGSKGSFEGDQVREIARALEKSGFRFLWSLRKAPPKGSRESPSEYSMSELSEVLPEGFLERTAQIGKVIGWAPQTQILAHQAVGGFVSHCGWNSTLESIYFGVPIATWPLYAEQQTNAFELVCELKMGVEIAMDYRRGFEIESIAIVSAERIEKGIRDLMEDQENEIRKKVKQMSEISRKALLEGGSSYSNISRLIDDIVSKE